MLSEQRQKAGTKPEAGREVHVFQRGGKDPLTGVEWGDRQRVFDKWHPYLEDLANNNPQEPVACVLVITDPDKPFTESRHVTHNLNMPVCEAESFLEHGLKTPSLDVSGMVDQFNAAINAKVVNITQASDPKLEELVNAQAEALTEATTVINALKDKLEAQEKQPKTNKPPSKGGK